MKVATSIVLGLLCLLLAQVQVGLLKLSIFLLREINFFFKLLKIKLKTKTLIVAKYHQEIK